MKPVRQQGSKRRVAVPAAPKRGPGRPRGTREAVGRDAIVAAARKLLEKRPPHEVTFALIARKAGVDPALVRYYFADRELLMLAAIESLLKDSDPRGPATAPPADQLGAYLSNILEFSRRNRYMQRLMIEGGAAARSAKVRARVRELNADAVRYLSDLLRLESGRPGDAPLDAMFLIGMCEFFAAAQPMIAPLAPRRMSPGTLARRYEAFLRELLLDGLRARLAAG
jgi:TetR/AcrR family transcriptional regulator